MKGIDVSRHNGIIDWQKVKNDNVDFAILRAGYGKLLSQKDTKFEENYFAAKSVGIPIGAYWYSYAKTIKDAEQEAQICLEVLKNKSFEMPIWYDVEEKSTFSTGKTNVSAIVKTFCNTLIAAGYNVGIYSSRSALTSYFSDEVKSKYDVWMANTGPNGATLNKTTYSGKYDIWQYSFKGKVSGINGNVDLDYCYKDYFQDGEVNNAILINKNEVNVFYCVTSDGENWYSEVKNDNDYAGVRNKNIMGFSAKTDKGILKYRVHIKNGDWLDWVEDYNQEDWNYGVAGIKGRIIDGIQLNLTNIDGYKVIYRVSTVGQNKWYPWVTNYDLTANGYAGVYGRAIDRIQIKIIKE